MTTEHESDEQRPIYTIQTMHRLTGVGVETLRAWERRYGFPSPGRTDGGHRLYSARAVEAVRWVKQKQREGMRAMEAIELWRAQAQVERPQPAPGTKEPNNLHANWVELCLRMDDAAASREFQQASAMLGPEEAVLQVLVPGVASVGAGWADGKASVAQEHFASALATRLVQALVAAEAQPAHPEVLLLASPPGDEHLFSLAVLHFLLRRHGWAVRFLGTNLPLVDLLNAADMHHPRLVLLTAQTFQSAGRLRVITDTLLARDYQPAFGGSIFVSYPALANHLGGHYLGGNFEGVPRLVSAVLSGLLAAQRPAALTPEWIELSRALPVALAQAAQALQMQAWPAKQARIDAAESVQLMSDFALCLAQLGAAELVGSFSTTMAHLLGQRGLTVEQAHEVPARFLSALDARLPASPFR